MITALVLNIWNTWPIENTFCFLGWVKKHFQQGKKTWLNSLHDNRESHKRWCFRWRQKPVFYSAGKLCINFAKGRRTVCMTTLFGNPRTDLLGTEWDCCAIVWYAWNHSLMGGWTLTDNSLIEDWMAVRLLHIHFFLGLVLQKQDVEVYLMVRVSENDRGDLCVDF